MNPNGYNDNFAKSIGRASLEPTGSTSTPSPIFGELGRLNEMVSRLHTVIDNLEIRLNPILGQSIPGGTAEKEEKVGVGLAEEISVNRRGVAEAYARIQNVIDRLAI